MMQFDQLIREGRDTDAVRLFAEQYYDGGKMGLTRYSLLMRVADDLEKATEAARLQRAIDRMKQTGNMVGILISNMYGVDLNFVNADAEAAEAAAEWCEAQKETGAAICEDCGKAISPAEIDENTPGLCLTCYRQKVREVEDEYKKEAKHE